MYPSIVAGWWVTSNRLVPSIQQSEGRGERGGEDGMGWEWYWG